ncbi:inositol polyphosphate-5-phosphatase A isoform X3 [Ailuropoda melanoleuca]|uniref:inositol polyphosphate-5-phosphatase A isoform X3 n=1 Tax=Ailuropoda melanoleuca TaxID=9646 RepID=UPI000947A1AB|nr:inositol polyphosphate-5-phosphatase A isoform X3 [Ailuropoda melanoleuca]
MRGSAPVAAGNRNAVGLLDPGPCHSAPHGSGGRWRRGLWAPACSCLCRALEGPSACLTVHPAHACSSVTLGRACSGAAVPTLISRHGPRRPSSASRLRSFVSGVDLIWRNHTPENLQKNWLREFYQVVHTHKPHFMALHCQEFGGKNYEASMSHVDKFVKELLSSDAMKEYNRARVYLDENFKSQEHFTALGSFYFLHESLKNIYQFDFKAKKYKKVTGKEIYSDTLESTPMLEKEKFPQDYFPECKWSRKGFVRTRWCVADCAFDLVNIHLFHDASNLVAWETSPSVYSGIRHKALGYVLDRIIDQRFEKVSYFVFGDFNFRLDSKSVVETLCTKATMQTVRAADTNEVVKLIFRESDNDRKVVLQLEKKLFDYVNQEVFRDNNGTALLEFDKELSVFKDRLYELDISFPPSYPYSEDRGQGRQYMNTRCPAWCDRVLMSPSARELILKQAFAVVSAFRIITVHRVLGN